MLTALRHAAGTWVAKLLLILLVLSFAVWGISGQIMGGLGSNVIQVGSTKVTVLEYRLAYDRQISLLSQQLGTPITREQARAFGIDNQVLGQLIAGAVLDEQAREMRLGMSRERLAALTAEDPAFRGPNGRFDRMQFEYVLRQVGMSPADYLKNREQVATRQQIVEAVSDGLAVPAAFLEAVSLHRGEDRTVEFLALPRSIVEPVEPPSDAEATTWFEENRSSYAAPEYRRISYLQLTPAAIADPATISDEDVRAYYDQNRQHFTTPERRTIEQLVFADTAAAEAALERIRAGATFEEIVTAEGKAMSDVVLGTFERDRVADPAVAQAAFALEANEVSEVVDGAFGPILLRVTAIEPEEVRSFESVATQIRDDLALDEANRILLDVYDAYEDSRAGGATMAEAAANQRLEVVTIEAVDRSGKTPEGTVLTDLPESSALLREAFETEAGIENSPIEFGSNGYLFYEVDSITPERDRSLDEVRDEVVADWTEREARTRLAARAAELEGELDGGKPLADIAASMELDAQTKRGLKRNTDDADLGEAGVAAVFGVAPGQNGVVALSGGDVQVLFVVTDVVVPMDAGPDSLPEQERTRLAGMLADDLLDQLVAQLQARYTVTIDQNAIQQALSF